MIRLMKLSVMLLVFKATTSREVRGQDCFLRERCSSGIFSLMDESDRPLYQGCRNTQSYLFLSNCTISSACVGSAIRQCRCSGITSRCFPERTFPHPSTRKIINRLGLNYEKIDAQTYCMLYWERTIGGRLVRSVTLRGSRLFGKGRRTAKILRYFPLKPRFAKIVYVV
ncbi:hypothetical protein K1719_036392 [Acacia pycnantha]|nr:hypothetical protein K1719_036392 [Acacia pycnantha]